MCFLNTLPIKICYFYPKARVKVHFIIQLKGRYMVHLIPGGKLFFYFLNHLFSIGGGNISLHVPPSRSPDIKWFVPNVRHVGVDWWQGEGQIET